MFRPKKELIDIHPCSDEELGLREGNARFMPNSKLKKIEVQKHSFYCLSEDDLRVSGHTYSETKSLIVVKVNRCVNEPFCKSKED